MDYRTEYQRALSLHQSGKYLEADALYAKLSKVKKSDLALQYYWGLLKLQLGDAQTAKDLLWQCYQSASNDVDIVYHLALAGQKLSQFKLSIHLYTKCIKLDSKRRYAWTNLAECYRQVNELDKAVDTYSRALTVMPDLTEAAFNLVLIYSGQGDIEKAATVLSAASKYASASQLLSLAQAHIFMRQGCYKEAIPLFRQALTDSELMRQALEGLVVSHKCIGEYNDAISLQKQIVMRTPTRENRIQLTLLEFTINDFANGWRDYLYRYDDTESRRVDKIKNTRLQDLRGKTIVVYKEQALGDEIFFLRLLSLVDSLAGVIYYACESKIIPLLPPQIKVIAPSEVKNVVADHVFRIGDLGYVGRVGIDTPVPPPFPLSPNDDYVRELKQKLNAPLDKPLLGLTWRAGSKNVGAMFKEIPLSMLANIIKDIDAQFVILQRQPLPGEINTLSDLSGKTFIDASHYNEDLPRMLALVYLLDDYISVSNTNIHLRASVVKPARVLVPNPPDWRWGAASDSSLWFPTFTVYRQLSSGDWNPALKKLHRDLTKH